MAQKKHAELRRQDVARDELVEGVDRVVPVPERVNVRARTLDGGDAVPPENAIELLKHHRDRVRASERHNTHGRRVSWMPGKDLDKEG